MGIFSFLIGSVLMKKTTKKQIKQRLIFSIINCIEKSSINQLK